MLSLHYDYPTYGLLELIPLGVLVASRIHTPNDLPKLTLTQELHCWFSCATITHHPLTLCYYTHFVALRSLKTYDSPGLVLRGSPSVALRVLTTIDLLGLALLGGYFRWITIVCLSLIHLNCFFKCCIFRRSIGARHLFKYFILLLHHLWFILL